MLIISRKSNIHNFLLFYVLATHWPLQLITFFSTYDFFFFQRQYNMAGIKIISNFVPILLFHVSKADMIPNLI